MSSVWFTSDWHIGHAAIIRHCHRPFADVEEMNETLIARHNEVVRDGDTVIHVGDFCWREQLVAPTLKRLRGAKHALVAGNHDKVHACHKKHEKATRRYLSYGFAEVLMRTTFVFAHGIEATICHLPYRHADVADQRYLDMRPVDRGGWLIHGHCHEKWRVLDRQVNVGVDVWNFTPVHTDQLLAIIRRQVAA